MKPPIFYVFIRRPCKEWHGNGEIAGVQIGKLWRFRASIFNDWLKQKIAS
jgi:hypothetical protein